MDLGEDTSISAEDTLKLVESLKLDISDVELEALIERAKKGESIERETLMNTVATILAADTEHLGELTGSIGNFEIEFR